MAILAQLDSKHTTISSELITAYGGLPLILPKVKENKLFKSICDWLNIVNPRDRHKYSNEDILLGRYVQCLCGLIDFSDIPTLKRDPLLQKYVELTSPATVSRFYKNFGEPLDAAKERKLAEKYPNLPEELRKFEEALLQEGSGKKGKRRKKPGPEKYDSDRITNATCDQGNMVLLDHAIDQLLEPSRRGKVVFLDMDGTFIAGQNKADNDYQGDKKDSGYFPVVAFLDGCSAWITNAPGATDSRKIMEFELPKILDRMIERGIPANRILVRADAGFSSVPLIDLMEKRGVKFVIGLTQTVNTTRALAESLSEVAIHWKDSIAQVIMEQIHEHCGRGNFHGDFKLEGEQAKPFWQNKTDYCFCGWTENVKLDSWHGARNLGYRVNYNAKRNHVDIRFVQTNLTLEELQTPEFGRLKGLLKRYVPWGHFPQGTERGRVAVDLYFGLYTDRCGACELSIQRFKSDWLGGVLQTKTFFGNWLLMFLAMVGYAIFEDIKHPDNPTYPTPRSFRVLTLSKLRNLYLTIRAKVRFVEKILTMQIERNDFQSFIFFEAYLS